MKLSQLLFSQGFGARRECEGLILGGHVTLDGTVVKRGVKPDLVIKGGTIAAASMGDPNASIPTLAPPCHSASSVRQSLIRGRLSRTADGRSRRRACL